MNKDLVSDVIKIGLDIGASTVKVSFYGADGKIKDISFPNRVDFNIENGDGTLVTIGNEKIKVGSLSGKTNSADKKINYKNLDFIMLDVANRVKDELKLQANTITFDIVTCLPPKQFKESKEGYRELLLNSAKKGTVKSKSTENKIEVIINSVRVGVEGVVLLKSFDLAEVASDLLKIMLIDIGSSTSDIILLERIGEAWKIKNAITSEEAGTSMCQDIENHLNSIHKGSYEWDNLELLGKYQLNQEVLPLTNLSNEIGRTVEQLLIDLRKAGSFTEYMPVLAGRGAKLLSKNKTFNEATKSIVVDPLNQEFGNSRGCLKS